MSQIRNAFIKCQIKATLPCTLNTIIPRSVDEFQISKRSISSTANQTYEGSSSLGQDVRSFDDIPGPRGMPILGTLTQYRLGIRHFYITFYELQIIKMMSSVCYK